MFVRHLVVLCVILGSQADVAPVIILHDFMCQRPTVMVHGMWCAIIQSGHQLQWCSECSVL